MSAQTVEPPLSKPGPDPEPAPRPDETTRPRHGAAARLRILLAWQAAAWALPPLLLGEPGGGVLLGAVLLLSVASLLRTGGVLLDRLVVAGLTTAGAVLLLGLLTPLWPWGLAPGATCTALLSAAGVWAAATGRRPWLPLRARPTDLLVLGSAGVAWLLLGRPMAGLDPAHQLAFTAISADMDEHFAIYDTIQRLGGYLFLDPVAAGRFVHAPTATVYPQGSHLLTAWLDLLLHGGRRETETLLAYDRYFHYVLAWYALLCGAVVWGARWVGGPRLRGWRAGAVCSGVCGLVLSGSLPVLLACGYSSEVTGLAAAALGVPLLVRPALRRPDRCAVAVAAVVLTGFAYNLYLPMVLAALAAGALARRPRPDWYAAALLGAALAVLPSAVSVLTALHVRTQADIGGASVRLRSLALAVGLLLAVGTALLTLRGRGTGTGRAVGATALGLCLLTFGFGWWQRSTVHHLSYYFEKSATCDLVVLFVLLGAVGWLLPARPRSSPALPVIAAAAAFCLACCVRWNLPSVKYNPWARGTATLLAWAEGRASSSAAGQLTTFAERDVHTVTADGASPVVALYSNAGGLNWRATFFANTLTQRQGLQVFIPDRQLYGLQLGGWPLDRRQYPARLAQLVHLLRFVPGRPTVLVGDGWTADKLQQDLPPLLHRRHQTADIRFAPLLGSPQDPAAAGQQPQSGPQAGAHSGPNSGHSPKQHPYPGHYQHHYEHCKRAMRCHRRS